MWILRWRIILLRITTWCKLFCLCLIAFTDFSSKRPTLSYQRLQTVQPLTDSELYDKIRRTVPNKHELQVLESFLIFNKFVFCSFSYLGIIYLFSNVNRHVLKTNFYQPTKVALSFRLAPDFLPEIEYPKKPFGMFIVIGTFTFQLGLFSSADFRDMACRKWLQRIPYPISWCCSWWDPDRDVEKQRVRKDLLWIS